jgi:large subunit ribosomal protein L18e
MGLDKQGLANVGRRPHKPSRTTNIYLKLLIKLYSFLARRADTKFNKLVLKRLQFTRRNKRPIPISRLAKFMAGQEDKIAVVVGTILNDERMMEVPKLRVCALSFTESARRRITEAGGEVITFDELAVRSPDGKGCVLLRGNYNTKVRKRFGVPGAKGSHARPKTGGQKGRKFEKARGRRTSRGFKVAS